MTKSILHVSAAFGAKRSVPAIAARLRAEGHDVETVQVDGRSKPHMYRTVLMTDLRIAHRDLIVVEDYNLACALAMKRAISRRRPPICAIGMNQSTKLLRSGLGPLDRWIDRVVSSIDLVVTRSEHERHLWKAAHGVPLERSRFGAWGFDLPEGSPGRFRPGPYVCMVGRNNRDLPTFKRACAIAGVKGVAILSKQTHSAEQSNDVVEIVRDASMADCVACVRDAAVNVVLVEDDDRGAGHITAVLGMHAGKPAVFSKVKGLADYLPDGEVGIGVPLHDAEACARSIRMLIDDFDLSARLGVNATILARRAFSHQSMIGQDVAVLKSFVDAAAHDRLRSGDARSRVVGSGAKLQATRLTAGR